MRAVIQRVKASEVKVGDRVIGSIGRGFNLLLGIKEDDTEKDMDYLMDVGGELLVVSQFTLYGDCRKGRRPSFSKSGPVDTAKAKYELFLEKLKKEPVAKIETGEFQAEMEVSIVNDGPVTLLLDSEKQF